jgi:hypothetical protein
VVVSDSSAASDSRDDIPAADLEDRGAIMTVSGRGFQTWDEPEEEQEMLLTEP